MTPDFETHETGTFKKLSTHTIALKLALRYIDALTNDPLSELAVRRNELEAARETLGPEFDVSTLAE